MQDKTTEIWNQLHDRLLGFIKSKVKSADLADDILQDVFIRIQLNLTKVKDTSKIESWVYQIARNAIAEHYRKSKPAGAVPDNPPESLEEPEDNEALESAQGWLGEFIFCLPEKYQDALRLTEIEGLSIKEFAEQEGLTYNNAKIRVHRGRQLLKESLERCCIFNVDKYGKVLDYKPNPNSRSVC